MEPVKHIRQELNQQNLLFQKQKPSKISKKNKPATIMLTTT
jgi:hypothetical protein